MYKTTGSHEGRWKISKKTTKATRRLSGLGIARRNVPLFIWVTSLKPYEYNHVPHCGIKMW